ATCHNLTSAALCCLTAYVEASRNCCQQFIIVVQVLGRCKKKKKKPDAMKILQAINTNIGGGMILEDKAGSRLLLSPNSVTINSLIYYPCISKSFLSQFFLNGNKMKGLWNCNFLLALKK
ncbi:unnamed protein product, partial [Musa acuminata subsp. burmannicoides]